MIINAPKSTIGFGTVNVKGRNLVPYPPTSTKAFGARSYNMSPLVFPDTMVRPTLCLRANGTALLEDKERVKGVLRPAEKGRYGSNNFLLFNTMSERMHGL